MAWFKAFLLGVLFLGLGLESIGAEEAQVTLEQGSIVTSKTTLENGVSYYAFKNIPFAQPPVGKLRFKNPEPAGPWIGVRDGSVEANECPQMDMMAILGGEIVPKGDEDCLYLQVYTQKPDSSANLPVMVWIHGGGFIMGSAQEYVPTHLMTKDVVVVLIQYRIGAFGFMSTEDEAMPGNFGLKDQVMALKWVQDNIKSFGGNPDSVTIFGESAGGMSVHYLMLSPMSQGLFHRAIAQSGTALIPSVVRDDHKDRAIDIGQMFECPGADPSAFDSQALVNCLQDLPQEKLALIGNAFTKYLFYPQIMEPNVDGEFFPEHPFKMAQEGNYHRVPFMTGINRNEGAFMVRPLIPNTQAIESLAQNFSTNGPLQLLLDPEIESEVYSAKRMIYHYVGDTRITEKNADSVEKLFGDILFNIPLDVAAQMHARDAAYGSKTFIYEFHHEGEFSFMDSPNITFGKHWISHGDEIAYLFTSPVFQVTLEKQSSFFITDMMVNMWTNFAATGNPTPDMSMGFKWDPISPSDIHRYLIIDVSPHMETIDRQKDMDFMLSLPTRHNKMFYPEKFIKKVK